jgi:hypothetical protein
LALFDAGGVRSAVDQARRLKPSIPRFAEDGTPISDELEFGLAL